MKKFFFLLLPLVLMLSTCEKKDDDPNPDDPVNIPDPAFLNALIDIGVDTNGDSLISFSEAEKIDTISIGGSIWCYGMQGPMNADWKSMPPGPSGDIINLKGIEAFKNLIYFDCCMNKITTLDVSSNTALTALDVGCNQLTSLDVSNNTALFHLRCGYNELTNIDVSNLSDLVWLECYNNQLSNLDVSNNNALGYFGCQANQLTELDVSNNTALIYFDCGSNQLTVLDVSNNTALYYLMCGANQLSVLDISINTQINELGISDMPTLSKVCIWAIPFDIWRLNTYGSPNVYYTTDCSK